MTEKKPSFPTVRYSRTEEPRLIQTQAELDALGPDWADSPAAFDVGYLGTFKSKPEHPEHPEHPEPKPPPTPPTPPVAPPKGPPTHK